MNIVVEKIMRISMLILFSIGAVSCVSGVESDLDWSVGGVDLKYEKEGGTKVVEFKNIGEWYVVSSENWCEVSPSSGNGDATLVIKVTDMGDDSKESRSAKVFFMCSNETKNICQIDVCQNEQIDHPWW